ncbi:hypothetical protein EDF58_1011337 [Novosphingobium sp. PhB57]|uniref:hypothetical protein n=1 Tax=Novosphingobium sp. PhB57 TaxID=2485107 RepID=UPI001043D4CD|nr:hypothetical protein [Novosphingobium sp. PhB57]TCU62004.1 hypothetical protein EDF58_1011337 [Novosphingobium sp. PhB57]
MINYERSLYNLHLLAVQLARELGEAIQAEGSLPETHLDEDAAEAARKAREQIASADHKKSAAADRYRTAVKKAEGKPEFGRKASDASQKYQASMKRADTSIRNARSKLRNDR